MAIAIEPGSEEYSAAIFLARRDPNAFCTFVARDQDGQPVEQGELHRVIQYHITYAWRHDQHAVIMGPPEHGKSVQVLYRLIWELGCNPDQRQTVTAADRDSASGRLLSMRAEIIENENIQRVFPHLVPADTDKRAKREWQKYRFYLERPGMSVDPSVQAAAFTGRNEGKRIDRLWGDDIVSREDWTSPTTRENTKRTWFSTWSNRLGSGGLGVLTNNCWHPDDLIHEFRGEGKDRYAVLWIAVNAECSGMDIEVLHVGDDYEVPA